MTTEPTTPPDDQNEPEQDQASSVGNTGSLWTSAVRMQNGQRFTEQLLKALGQRPVSDLSGDVPKAATEESLVDSAEDIEDTNFGQRKREADAKNDAIKNEILEAERDRLKQQEGHRRVFFVWSIAAITAVLVFNGTIFWWYMNAEHGTPSDAVLISWMSTSIVEVIGLGYIIARSLFRSENDSPPTSKADKKASKKSR